MTIIFTITAVGSSVYTWKLRHNPEWEVPFITVEGPHHTWNWDFISGSLLQDGQPLSGHTITIEREHAQVQPA